MFSLVLTVVFPELIGELALFASKMGSTVVTGTTTVPVVLTNPSPVGATAITDISGTEGTATGPEEAFTLITSMEELIGSVWFKRTKVGTSPIVKLVSCAEIDSSNPVTARSKERRTGVVVFIFKSDRETL
jgi:hypothetical protein